MPHHADEPPPPALIEVELDAGDLDPGWEPVRRGPGALARLRARLRGGPPPDRRTGVALLAVLVLLTGAAGAPYRSPLVEVVARALSLGADFLVTADRLYVTGDGPRGTALTAYGLPSGRHLWTVQPAAGRSTSLLSASGGDTLLIGVTGRDGALGSWSTTSAVDAGTGRLRWTYPALIEPVTDEVGTARPPALTAVDLRTGRPLWNARVPGATLAALPGRPGTGALIHPDGQAELRELRTGRVLRRQRLLAAGQQLVTPVQAGSRTLILAYWGDAGSGLVAYDGVTLVPRWHRPRVAGSDLVACGPTLCVREAESTVALDPLTGAVQWAVRGGWAVAPDGPILWRTADDGQRGWLARPATDGAVHILDSFPFRLSECQLARTAIACRAAPGDVRVWSFRD
ncbi:outer membrane protein assembly factor BamB family protein [Rhizomonospora bruguierae]|uniref:outer membrane protein assembly factor BamB family protein n=1 Tax=Rhizomonospora bruguierae TaxID=1581705 RepID=UPI001BD0184D|nr:PQQ-binding-like beta-propeller repeat protein [Micromonospora sp. NBRC 107566]